MRRISRARHIDRISAARCFLPPARCSAISMSRRSACSSRASSGSGRSGAAPRVSSMRRSSRSDAGRSAAVMRSPPAWRRAADSTAYSSRRLPGQAWPRSTSQHVRRQPQDVRFALLVAAPADDPPGTSGPPAVRAGATRGWSAQPATHTVLPSAGRRGPLPGDRRRSPPGGAARGASPRRPASAATLAARRGQARRLPEVDRPEPAVESAEKGDSSRAEMGKRAQSTAANGRSRAGPW